MRGRIANAIKKITDPDPDPTTLRTTEMKYGDYPPFKDGCPQCGEKPLITESRFSNIKNPGIEIRICRCRICPWRGRVLK